MGSPRYTILGAIHRGGMGEILLAQMIGAEGFTRKVVLKGLLPQLHEDAVSHALFAREALLMARLEHPNIVRVFDVPEIEGRTYLAMEYVRGRNFHQVIQKHVICGTPVPPRIALHVVAEALRGLHYAHGARSAEGTPLGIVHRDVSPGNLLLSFFGEVKVTDFGIAKVANAPNVTGPRSIRGKARYVAPEVVRGRPAGVASDVYSAGVVLAEALIGEPLFERNDVSETLSAIINEPRDVTMTRICGRVQLPLDIVDALSGAIAMKPSERWSSAIAFADALDQICRSLGGPVTSSELGATIRELFRGAADVPEEARVSSLPAPGPPPFALSTPPPPPPPPVEPVEQPAFYLSELVSSAASTDEERARSPGDRALSEKPRAKVPLLRHPWMLVFIGILIGAAMAIAGSMLALLTSR